MSAAQQCRPGVKERPDYSSLLPRLTAEEFEALKADITERGCLVPVEVDEDGNVLDGAHRLRACAELGIEAPTITRTGLSEDEKRAHAIALNLQRRQLGKEQRRALHRDLRTLGKSLREIAEASGAPKSTVADDVAGVRNQTPDRTTGRDGKSYPAKRPARGKPAKVKEATARHMASESDRRKAPAAEKGQLNGNGGSPSTPVQSPAEQLAAFSAECQHLAKVAAALEVEVATQDAEQSDVDGWRDDFCELREQLDRLTELTYSSNGRVR